MIRVLGIIAAVALSSAVAFAGEWPSKPVRLVVPFAAGGAADTMGRLYGDALTTAFGKQFYVENRVGVGGLVGTESVARAEPDGLTLMVSGIPTHVAMNKNVGFDAMRDFTHIAYFGGTPNLLIVHPSLGVASYRDFLARAQMNRKLYAALKPGGLLVIADHSARPGDGTTVGKTLHRIEESVLRREVEAAGFKLVAEGDFLRHPEDARDSSVFRPTGPVDEFVLSGARVALPRRRRRRGLRRSRSIPCRRRRANAGAPARGIR